MPKIRTALVIGAGIAGPVAATALAKAGIAATVYEAYPAELNGIGGPLGLAPNGLAALAIIDEEEAVRSIALPISHTATSIAGKNLGRMPQLPDLPPRQVIERSDLHRVLRDRAVAAGVRFEYGKRLVGVDDGPDGIIVRFAEGSTTSGEVLVGADGIHSMVGTMIDPGAPAPGYTGLLGFCGHADVSLDLEPNTMTFAFGKRAYYLYWPLPGGGITWVANLPSRKYLTLTEARAIPAEDWLRTLREVYADDLPGAELAKHTSPDSLQIIGGLHIMPPVPHWHLGRMVLVGDSVHAPSNSTGQGASLAIESAIELARCLRDLPEPASAFAAYERLRRARVERIATLGAKINLAKRRGPLARWARSVVLPSTFESRNLEKALSAEQRYTIDWDAPVSAQLASV